MGGTDEDAGGAGDYVKSLVFGGLDGIITTFAIVATVAGARAHPGLVLLMGAANLVADALSMGIGDYLSERAEDEYVASEQRRELAELRTGKRAEKVRKLRNVYEKAGLSTSDAKKCVDALNTKDEVIVAHTMMARLQLVPPDDWLGERVEEEDEFLSLAAKKGATTAASFVLFGAMPLLAYYATVATSVSPTPERMFTASCLVTTSTLVALGSAKARLTAQPVFESALGMVINGGAAAVAAYGVGHALEAFQHASSFDGFESETVSEPLQMPRWLARAFASAPVVTTLEPLDVLFECSAALGFAALGAIPCVLMGFTSPSSLRLAHAAAGGAVVATASALALDAARDDALATGLGAGLGIIFSLVLRREDEGQARGLPAALAVLSHAASEGLALGLAYAKSPEDGRIARMSVLAHNVPEGLATAAVLKSKGVSSAMCVLAALFAVVPQPLFAAAAFSFASRMAALQTVFLGFAAALMFMIALTELLPDALSSASKKSRDVCAAVACVSAVACVCGSAAALD